MLGIKILHECYCTISHIYIYKYDNLCKTIELCRWQFNSVAFFILTDIVYACKYLILCPLQILSDSCAEWKMSTRLCGMSWGTMLLRVSDAVMKDLLNK